MPLSQNMRVSEAVVYDLFCGPGEDRDGTLGSPLRARDVILHNEENILRSDTTVKLVFNDYLQDHIDALVSKLGNSIMGASGEELAQIEYHARSLKEIWKARCGDNFYGLDDNGEWRQHRIRFHIGREFLIKDTRHPFAFIGREFWYFGRSAMKSPKRFDSLRGGRGIRVNHDRDLAADFISWVSSNWKPGIHDLPSDNPDIPA